MDVALTKSKLAKTQADTDALKAKFIQLFSEEMESRKGSYFEAKEKKDEVFREIEHLKTSLRLIENKSKKRMNTKAGGYYPLKVEVRLANANLAKNKDSIVGKDIEDDLEIYYKMDNGKDLFKSDSCKNIENPFWTNTFLVALENNQERLYFQVFVISDIDDKSERLVDTFDISASIIEQHLRSNDELTDNISTSISNFFTLCIKSINDTNPKIETYKARIAKLEEALAEVEPPYKEARNRFEKFLHLKGVELLDEWGIWGSEMKLVKKAKTGKIENETTIEDSKIAELDLDQDDRSYLGKVMKSKTKRLDSTLKTPEKSFRHTITKMSPSEKYAAPVAQVNLDEGPEPVSESKEQEVIQVEEAEDKQKKMIGKTPIHKTTKLSTGLFNGKDLNMQKTSEVINVAKKEKNMHGIAPVKQLFLGEESSEKPAESTSLTTEALRSNNLGSKRKGLTSSLVNFAMEDVARVNKVKSEYNQSSKVSTIYWIYFSLVFILNK